jgi:hypothetical protein
MDVKEVNKHFPSWSYIGSELPQGKKNTGELSFNVQFQRSQLNKFSDKLSPFTVFLSLVFKSTALQKNLK